MHDQPSLIDLGAVQEQIHNLAGVVQTAAVAAKFDSYLATVACKHRVCLKVKGVMNKNSTTEELWSESTTSAATYLFPGQVSSTSAETTSAAPPPECHGNSFCTTTTFWMFS
jgi:hypothetical protein